MRGLALLAATPLLLGAGLARATPAAAAERHRVVVVAVPDLRWADVAAMPHLRAIAVTGAVGELSTKSADRRTTCAAGSLTFSAGNRVHAGDDACELDPARLAELRRDNWSSVFAARIGAFGSALRAAGLTVGALDRAAVPLVADETGQVDDPRSRAGATPGPDVVATVDQGLYRAGADRAGAAARVDDRLAALLESLPRDTDVVVAGTSDGASGASHLHVLVISGPGWRHRELTSASTGRTPFVQLTDLAPTVLAMVGVGRPSSMPGRAVRLTGSAVPPAATYVDDDEHAVAAGIVSHSTVLALCALTLLVLLLVAVARRRPRWRRVAAWLARAVVVAPVCTYLVQVLPWWRWGSAAYTAVVVVLALALGAGVVVFARRSAYRAVVAPAVLTATVLVADQLAGAPLQLSAPMGDNPIVAGRFHGMGNIDFAIACSSLLLVAGVVGGRLVADGRRRAGIGLAAAVALVAVVVDGAPVLGDDFGGLLSVVPAAIAVVALVAGVRVTWRRVLLVVAGVAVVAVGVALADYARPASDQTHIGRFVGEVLHGGAGTVLRRKLSAAAGSITGSVVTWLVVAGVLLAVAAASRRRIAAAATRLPGLTGAVVGVAVVAVLGSLLNDSGIVVAAFALVATVPPVVAADVIPWELSGPRQVTPAQPV